MNESGVIESVNVLIPPTTTNMRPLSHAFQALSGKGGISTRSAADNGLLRFGTIFFDEVVFGSISFVTSLTRQVTIGNQPRRTRELRLLLSKLGSSPAFINKDRSSLRAGIDIANGPAWAALKKHRTLRKSKPETTGACRGPVDKSEQTHSTNDLLNGDVGRQGRAECVHQHFKSSGFDKLNQVSGSRNSENQGNHRTPALGDLWRKKCLKNLFITALFGDGQ